MRKRNCPCGGGCSQNRVCAEALRPRGSWKEWEGEEVSDVIRVCRDTVSERKMCFVRNARKGHWNILSNI